CILTMDTDDAHAGLAGDLKFGEGPAGAGTVGEDVGLENGTVEGGDGFADGLFFAVEKVARGGEALGRAEQEELVAGIDAEIGAGAGDDVAVALDFDDRAAEAGGDGESGEVFTRVAGVVGDDVFVELHAPAFESSV